MSRSEWLGRATVTVVAASAMACAEPEFTETRGITTAKLLKPAAAAELPASDALAFQQALGGVPIDIDRWAGYVAGTEDGALFLLHLSGARGDKPIAGLSIAFVEEAAASTTGDLEARLRNAGRLEVRFNDGTKIVSTHTFGSPPSTYAAHRSNANAQTLLQRAFNDAEALLRAPKSIVGGSDAEGACVANFLMTVSNAARCVDDAANTLECGAVRGNAMDAALACQGTKTANVLADADPNVLTTRALPTSGLGGLANLTKLFGTFSSLGKGGILGSLLGGKGGGILGSLLGGGSATSGGSPLLSTALKFLPKLFGNANGLKASPQTGGVSTADLGGRGDDDDDDND
jgi:hypothetical protein